MRALLVVTYERSAVFDLLLIRMYSHKQLYRSFTSSSSNISKSSSRSCGSSCTSGSERLPDFEAENVGDCGLSVVDAWKEDSTDDAELGYLKCPDPDLEKVGVTGEGTSEMVDVCEYTEDDRSISPSSTLSLFLLSSTSCGNNNGFSFGDIVIFSSPFLL